MALNAGDRAFVNSLLQREWSGRNEQTGAMTKADLLAAVAAVDDWIDANAASYNQALPQPARDALTAPQKVELLYRVARRRYEVD